jgi:hypothetical protein
VSGWTRLPRELAEQRILGVLKEGEFVLLTYLLARGADRPGGYTATAADLAAFFEKAPDPSTVTRYLQRLRELEWLTYEVGEGRGGGYKLRAGPAWHAVVDEPAAAKPPAADELRPALVAAIGHEPITAQEEKVWRAAEADLRKAEATPAEIIERGEAFRKLHKDAAITPTALARGWGRLGAGRRGPAPVEPCSACGVGGGLHAADCDHANTNQEDG